MIEALARGDIKRRGLPNDSMLNLYQGSGRSGCCFRWHGLHESCDRRPGHTKTSVMHADHWLRGGWGIDCWLPVYSLEWDRPPVPTRGWEQHLDLFQGRLDTSYTANGVKISISTTFSPAHRDVMALTMTWQGPRQPSPFTLLPCTSVGSHYEQTFSAELFSLEAAQQHVAMKLRTTHTETLIEAVLRGDAVFTATDKGYQIYPGRATGQLTLLIAVGNVGRRNQLRQQLATLSANDPHFLAAQAWERRWGDAFVDLRQHQLQALWARSAYYVLSSYAPDVRAPAAPMGWSGNGWPFHFPQDVSYVHPALLRLGHVDIARGISEFYRHSLEETVEATRRIYDLPGAMCPWEHPIGRGFGKEMLAGGAPNQFQCEIHNAAYPARMAIETAAYLKDPEWTRNFAWPIVREAARFLGAGCTRGSDGLWNLLVTPSSGQDEFGGVDQPNFLCALQSAKYLFKKASQMARELEIVDEPDLPKWRQILADGLATSRLLDAQYGLYATHEAGVGTPWIGKEKHPVQMNSLMFLPMGEPPDGPTCNAYDQRHVLCAGLDGNVSHGWTLAAYWLAGAHLGDPDGLEHDLGLVRPMDYVDEDYIQIYETSGCHNATYYVTSHGLYMQAVQDAIISDYWGTPEEYPACPDSWEGARFGNLRTADGERHSGEV